MEVQNSCQIPSWSFKYVFVKQLTNKYRILSFALIESWCPTGNPTTTDKDRSHHVRTFVRCAAGEWGLSEAGLKPKRLRLRPALAPRWVRHELTAGASDGGQASNAGLFDLYSLQPQIAKNLVTAKIWRNATKVDHCCDTFLLQRGGKGGKGPPLRRPIVQNCRCRQIVHFLVSCLRLFKIANAMHENFHQNFPISCFQNCQCVGWTLCCQADRTLSNVLFEILVQTNCTRSKTGGSSEHFPMSCF